MINTNWLHCGGRLVSLPTPERSNLEMEWYRKFVGRYRRKTLTLSQGQHGSYVLLMDEYYLSQGPLPPDDAAIYRICLAISRLERKNAKTVADQYFPISEDGLRHNKTCDEEIAHFVHKSDTNRAIAIAREEARRVARTLHERDTNRAPIDREIDRKKEGNCGASLPQGKTCDEPTAFWTRTGKPNGCRLHGPF